MITASNEDYNVINNHIIKFDLKWSILLWLCVGANKVNCRLFHVKCTYFSDFNQGWEFETEFNKCLKYKVLRKPV
jgi:hypothetical protein